MAEHSCFYLNSCGSKDEENEAMSQIPFFFTLLFNSVLNLTKPVNHRGLRQSHLEWSWLRGWWPTKAGQAGEWQTKSLKTRQNKHSLSDAIWLSGAWQTKTESFLPPSGDVHPAPAWKENSFKVLRQAGSLRLSQMRSWADQKSCAVKTDGHSLWKWVASLSQWVHGPGWPWVGELGWLTWVSKPEGWLVSLGWDGRSASHGEKARLSQWEGMDGQFC